MLFRFILLILSFSPYLILAQVKTLGEKPLQNNSAKRVAIIYGNQDYEKTKWKLNKIYNDLTDTKEALGSIGFDIMLNEKDLTFKDFNSSLNKIQELVKNAEVVFFYYSGHGVEYEGENYLIPVDFPDLENLDSIKNHAISLSYIYKTLDFSGCETKILAIDACRDVPTIVNRGFKTNAQMRSGMILPSISPSGTYTMFAAKSKMTALENEQGRNSYFTQELLKNIIQPDNSIASIFRKTKNGVERETGGRQEPCALDDLTNDVVLLKTNKVITESAPRSLKPTNGGENSSNQDLRLSVKTNKGTGKVEFFEGEKMNLYYSVTQPCYLRIIYKLADDRLVLLTDEIEVNVKYVNQWNTITDEFICSPPFGFETLIAFASSKPFNKLDTYQDPDGYICIKGSLDTAVETIRGMKRYSSSPDHKVAEDQILIRSNSK